MIQNPEFQRNTWLELTPQRMMVVPVFLVVILLLCYTTLSGHRAHMTAAIVSLAGFGAFTILWGSFQVSQALVLEVNSNTWEFQRMSSVDPWQMSWGKIFGSTIFHWYGGLLCLIAYLVTALAAGWSQILYTTQLMLGIAVLVQAFSFLATLLTLRKRSELKVRRIGLVRISLLFLVAYSLGNSFFSVSRTVANSSVNWHSFVFPTRQFILASLYVFVLWGLLGAYRVMRKELMYQNAPWVWIGFVLFVMAYASGFLNNIQTLIPKHSTGTIRQEFIHSATFYSKFLLSFGIGALLSYSVTFLEPKDPVVFRRWFHAFRAQRWGKLLQITPAWVYTLIITFLALAVVLFYPLHLPKGDMIVSKAKLGFLSCGLFLLRDIGVIVLLSFSMRPQRADMMATLYLVLFWGMLPSLVIAAKGQEILFVLLPSFDGSLIKAVIPPLVQVVIVFLLCRSRWQETFAKQALDSQP